MRGSANMKILPTELVEPSLDAVEEGTRALMMRAGRFPENPSDALRILVEEVGEVAREINPADYTDVERLYEELTQVAAVALIWMARIRREKVDVQH